MNPFAAKNLNITISAVAIVVVLSGVYWYFFGGISTSATSLSETSAQGSGTGQIFLLTSEIANVSFDTSLLSDPRFAVLKDISTPIAPEPQGRTDPFAPI